VLFPAGHQFAALLGRQHLGAGQQALAGLGGGPVEQVQCAAAQLLDLGAVDLVLCQLLA
jgi:hypothetical protein